MINKKTIWILLFICLNQNLLIADKFKVTASHTDKIKTLQALVDGVVPASSTDYRVARHTFLPHQGTMEWYECDFSEEVNLKNEGSNYKINDSNHDG